MSEKKDNMMTAKAIAKSLEKIPLDGSNWLIPNEKKEYLQLRDNLITALKYNTKKSWDKVTKNNQLITDLNEWKNNTSTWESILEHNDVAMFPPCLDDLKIKFQCIMDKKYCEGVNRLSYTVVHESGGTGLLYHKSLISLREEYGVFRFRNTVGDNMFKALRRHLNVTRDDFTSMYGLALHDDPCACDELLIEMLVSGRLSGAIRSYKIEREYSS